MAAVGGSATFVGLVLNDAADGYTATAASPGLTSGVSNAFDAAPPRQLVITTVVPNHQAGTPLAVTVEARDANNSVAENFSGTVSLNAAATGGSNFVGGTKNVVAVAGVATFPGLVLNDAADNYSITASSPGLTDGLSNSFNVTATHLAILAIGNVRAGDPFNVTVQGRDANNNVAENFARQRQPRRRRHRRLELQRRHRQRGRRRGSATFVGLVLNDAADGYTATAASPGLTNGVSNAFNVTARQLVITTVVPNHQAGTPLAVTVEARDANNRQLVITTVVPNHRPARHSPSPSRPATPTTPWPRTSRHRQPQRRRHGRLELRRRHEERRRRRGRRDVPGPRAQRRRRQLLDHRLVAGPDQRGSATPST